MLRYREYAFYMSNARITHTVHSCKATPRFAATNTRPLCRFSPLFDVRAIPPERDRHANACAQRADGTSGDVSQSGGTADNRGPPGIYFSLRSGSSSSATIACAIYYILLSHSPPTAESVVSRVTQRNRISRRSRPHIRNSVYIVVYTRYPCASVCTCWMRNIRQRITDIFALCDPKKAREFVAHAYFQRTLAKTLPAKSDPLRDQQNGQRRV